MDKTYTSVEDFAAEESFQDFCLGRSEKHIQYWEQFQKGHPEKKAIMEEAKFFVFLLADENEATISSKTSREQTIFSSRIWKYTASIILVLSLSILGFILTSNDNEQFDLISKKAESNNHSILLTDLSKIELRKNSELKFLESWENSKEREVWLSGEAYFEVEKSNEQKKAFLVHLDRGSISVLGTKFLVKSDSISSKVILEEGEIAFQVNNREYFLSPGDLLTYDDEMVSIVRNQNIDTYDSWRKSTISFQNTRLEQVISTISNSYDLKVELGNKSLKDRKITATIDQNDPMLVLQAISAIYDIEIISENNKIVLK